jgi:hypothetical protein
MGLWAAEVTPLQFSLVAESAMPPTPTYRRVSVGRCGRRLA